MTSLVDGVSTQLEYVVNAAGNASPKLLSSTTGAEITRFSYDDSGKRSHESGAARKLRLAWNDDRRLERIHSDAAGKLAETVKLHYDGRGFRELAASVRDGC